MADPASPIAFPPSAPLPPILKPSLKVGLATGCTGFVFGGVAAVLRGTPTVKLFAAGSGLNCFALGSTYWAVRIVLMRAAMDPSSKEKGVDVKYVSGAAGAITGFTLGGLFRGPSNVIPGAIVWGLLGLGGQYAYDLADARRAQKIQEPATEQHKKSLWERAMRSKWSPVKVLTNEEYAKMLEEKMLRVDAEIAITREEIEGLEKRLKEEQEPAGRNSKT